MIYKTIGFNIYSWQSINQNFDRSYHRVHRKLIFNNIVKNVKLFGEKYKLEWGVYCGDSYDIAVTISEKTKPISEDIRKQFKQLVSKLGRIENEINMLPNLFIPNHHMIDKHGMTYCKSVFFDSYYDVHRKTITMYPFEYNRWVR